MRTEIAQGFFFFQVENLESKLLGILLNIDKKLNNTEVSVDEKEKVKLISSLLLLLLKMYRNLIYFPSWFHSLREMIFSDISDSNCCHEAHGTPKYNTCKEKNNQHFKVHVKSVIHQTIWYCLHFSITDVWIEIFYRSNSCFQLMKKLINFRIYICYRNSQKEYAEAFPDVCSGAWNTFVRRWVI